MLSAKRDELDNDDQRQVALSEFVDPSGLMLAARADPAPARRETLEPVLYGVADPAIGSLLDRSRKSYGWPWVNKLPLPWR